MKVTLSVSELTALVCERYSLPTCTVLEISDYVGVESVDAANLVAALNLNGCLDSNGVPRPDKKIASIKLLRELVIKKAKLPQGENVGYACGLAQAKYAIEDWANFIAYVRRFGFPNMSSNSDYGWRA